MGKEYESNGSLISKIIMPVVLVLLIQILIMTFRGQQTLSDKRHSSKQNLIFSYLCDVHDLELEAEEYRKAEYPINYWSEADKIGKMVANNPKSDVSEKWKNLLFDLIDYAEVAEDSIGIIYYNIARIENAQGKKEDAKGHLQEAKKYSQKIIEKREKIDPLFKS